MDGRKIALSRKLMADPDYSVSEICRTLGVSSSTLYRHASSSGSYGDKAEMNAETKTEAGAKMEAETKGAAK